MAQQMRLLLAVFAIAGAPLHAYEFKSSRPEFSVSGVVSSAGQCGEDGCYTALPIQPEISLRPGEPHELFAKFGVAAGNGMNAETTFNIAPWAADLESDVENVGGRTRNGLLTAWYAYTARVGEGRTLSTTVGLIDATDYLDSNVYSNDEYTQFMNSALVNGPNAFLPSYDRGLSLNYAGRRWSAHAVFMNVGENDDGLSFNFVGMQIDYRLDTALGTGNYRLLVDATDDRFYDPGGTSLEQRSSILISCDQQLGETVGLFTRIGRQSENAAVDYSSLYSGGIDLNGTAWGREGDNLGIGYAYLSGGNTGLVRSQVFETYYRFAVNKIFAVTGDVQYMMDDREFEASPRGYILGLRLAAEF